MQKDRVQREFESYLEHVYPGVALGAEQRNQVELSFLAGMTVAYRDMWERSKLSTSEFKSELAMLHQRMRELGIPV
jgi:hypothetical protein